MTNTPREDGVTLVTDAFREIRLLLVEAQEVVTHPAVCYSILPRVQSTIEIVVGALPDADSAQKTEVLRLAAKLEPQGVKTLAEKTEALLALEETRLIEPLRLADAADRKTAGAQFRERLRRAAHG